MLGLLCLAFFFDYADRFILASLFPFIKQDWGISDQALGTLSGILALPMAVLVLPLSVAVDRWSRRKMIALMVFLWSLATLSCAFAQNFTQLLIARAMTGRGGSGVCAGIHRLDRRGVPPPVASRATGIWDAFAPLGSAVGFFVGGYIGLHYGWRHAFGIMAVPGILLALGFLFVRDYRTVPLGDAETTRAGNDGPRLWSSFLGLFQIRTLRFVWLAFAMNFAINTAMMSWMPSYFHRFHGMNEQQAGTVSGMLALLALVGAPVGGILADRWMRRRGNARMVFSAIVSALSAFLLLTALLFAHTPAFIPLMVGFGIFSVAFLAPGAAVIQDVVHPGLRAMGYGLNVLVLQLLGASWTPWFVGLLSDLWGLENALLVLPLFGLAATILFLAGAGWYEKDLANVKNIVLLEE